MYADDNNDGGVIQSRLNEDLLNISKWLIANKLTRNMTKSKFMLMGSIQKLRTRTTYPVLTINSSPINQGHPTIVL